MRCLDPVSPERMTREGEERRSNVSVKGQSLNNINCEQRIETRKEKQDLYMEKKGQSTTENHV